MVTDGIMGLHKEKKNTGNVNYMDKDVRLFSLLFASS
jgi:hypothetical protein